MNILKSAIILNKISDHLPCLAVISVKKNKRKIPKYVNIQNNSEEAISNFKKELTSKIANTVFEQNILANPNINYNKLNDILIQCKLNNMPTKRVRFNRHKHKIAPWITYGIIESTKQKAIIF